MIIPIKVWLGQDADATCSLFTSEPRMDYEETTYFPIDGNVIEFEEKNILGEKKIIKCLIVMEKEYKRLRELVKWTPEETKKYYLVSYSYKDSTSKVQNANAVIDENPFDWLFDTVERDYKRHQKEKKHFENYVLLNYWELTREQYEKMEGTIG